MTTRRGWAHRKTRKTYPIFPEPFQNPHWPAPKATLKSWWEVIFQLLLLGSANRIPKITYHIWNARSKPINNITVDCGLWTYIHTYIHTYIRTYASLAILSIVQFMCPCLRISKMISNNLYPVDRTSRAMHLSSQVSPIRVHCKLVP